MTENQQKLADSFVTIAKYAKTLLPENGKELLDYIATEIGKVADEDTVTVAEAIQAGRDGVVAICDLANAPHVGELIGDVGDFVVDAANGQPFEAFKKLLELPHDIKDIKKLGK